MREWLDGRVSAKVLDDALLLVSELVTNSVRHAGEAVGAPLHVSADLTAGVLRLRVTDGGRNGAVAPRAPSHDGGGYGLHLIDQLAARWGVDRGGGTQVWCELVCEPDSPLPRRSRAAGAALPAH